MPMYARFSQRRGGLPIDIACFHVAAIASGPGGTDVYVTGAQFDVAEPIDVVRKRLGWED